MCILHAMSRRAHLIAATAVVLIAAWASNRPSYVEGAPQQTTGNAPARSVETGVAEVQARQAAPSHGGDPAGTDTTLHRVRAGNVLIVALPAEIEGEKVARYMLVRAPALSWLIDRSLMWRTTPQDAGTYEMLIRFEPSGSPTSDTLHVSIIVE